MTTEQAVVDESQGRAGDRPQSYGAAVAKCAFAAVWLLVLAFALGALGQELVAAAGKSKLLNPGAFPLNATMLGFVTIVWWLLPVIYGALSVRWLGRDAVYVAPGVATIVFALATILRVEWSGFAAFLPLALQIVFISAATFVGAVAARIVSGRRARRSES